MDEEQWFYVTGGTQAGPVGREELQRLVADGALQREDQVWREGLPSWIAASEVDGLFETPVETSPPVVAPAPSGVAPPAAVLQYDDGGGYASVSARAAHALAQTRPWAFFIGILGFLFGALCVVVVIGSVVATGMFWGRRGGGSGFAVIIILTYGTMAAFAIVPSYFLMRYAWRIGKLKVSRRLDDLERALDAQKAFWQLTGVLAILMLLAYGGAITYAIVSEL